MVRPVLVAFVLASTLLVGCVTELLEDEQTTVRTVSCAVLDPTAQPVLLSLHREAGGRRVPLDALWAVAHELEGRGFGDGRFSAVESDLLEHDGAWTVDELASWAADAEVLGADAVRLHVLWVGAFDDADQVHTVRVVAPGVVAVSEAAVQAGAERSGRSETFLARALLFHVVGHALGAVNQGIPLNGTDPAAQEGPAGHEPDPDSVMNVAWERVTTLPPAGGNATYAHYSDAVVDDWRAAWAPGGVCA